MISCESGVTFGEFNSVAGSETVHTQSIVIHARNGCNFPVYRHPAQAMIQARSQHSDRPRGRWAEPIHTTTSDPRDDKGERAARKDTQRTLLRSLMQNLKRTNDNRIFRVFNQKAGIKIEFGMDRLGFPTEKQPKEY